MHLELKRDTFTNESTIGKLYVDGKFFCHTLEDVVRAPGEKVAGKTAIPAGTYTVTWEKSPRLSKLKGRDYYTPRLHGVPGFSGVLIHAGSYPIDTDGCILTGYNRGTNYINGSRDATKDLYALIGKETGPISITIN